MLDLNEIEKNSKEIINRLNTRGTNYDFINELIEKNQKRKKLIFSIDELKNQRNLISKQIGQNLEKRDVLKKQVLEINEEIKNIEKELNDIEEFIKEKINIIPNIPYKDVPIGSSSEDNKEIRRFGEIRKTDFVPQRHFELGEKLDILDFERASKITGSRFVVYKGLGARLERALINFMIDTHVNYSNYKEIIPPFIVNDKSLYATGQLPKFEEDLFKIADNRNWYLNPTAEVPTINMHRDEIINGEELPIKYASFTTAFRSEAGSAGRDTRGILRLHQFNKVELIKLTKPEESYLELEKMLNDSERILKLLGIPYRVVVLCTGDMGFGAALTYDIEIWIPGENTYREVASISNAEDFQARRGNIRFRREKNSKPEFVHILNGSGLAVGRTLIAVMENYQTKEGTIIVPEVLIPYMNGVKEIK